MKIRLYQENVSEIKNMWIDSIDHIQITSSSEAEDAMLFFYSKVLGLRQIPKPEAVKANRGTWYLLGEIQLHTSIEQNPSNETSRRHICFRVRNLNRLVRNINKVSKIW